GDSGGPLMVDKASVWYQIGVTSYGNDKHPLEGDKFPDTYTRVSRYCDWIEKTTQGAAKCMPIPA
ncbi:chymotrypsin-like serine protease precursor, partial [Aphelenchoides avenae]